MSKRKAAPAAPALPARAGRRSSLIDTGVIHMGSFYYHCDWHASQLALHQDCF